MQFTALARRWSLPEMLKNASLSALFILALGVMVAAYGTVPVV